MSRGRIAVSVMPLETRREVLIAVARMADRLGYDAFSMPETWAHDITVLLAEVALKTERIGIGTGILGVWNRGRAEDEWMLVLSSAEPVCLTAGYVSRLMKDAGLDVLAGDLVPTITKLVVGVKPADERTA